MSARLSRPALIPLAVALAAAVSGCGGNSALSATEFRARANAICEELNLELQQETTVLLAADAEALATVEKLAGYFLDVALPNATEKLDRLERLEPPEADREAFERLIAEGREAVAGVESGLQADPDSLIQGELNPLGEFEDTARELGLTRCAAPQRPSDQQPATTTTAAPDATEP